MIQDAVIENYHDTERLRWSLIHKFYRKFGPVLGDREELHSFSNELFMEAVQTWDKRESSFHTWTYLCITRGLLDALRKKARNAGKVVYLTDLVPPHDNRHEWHTFIREGGYFVHFFPFEFVESLTDDAKEVVSLVLDTPEDLRRCMVNDDPNPSPCATRKGLREYFLGKGWPRVRITEAFNEICEALFE